MSPLSHRDRRPCSRTLTRTLVLNFTTVRLYQRRIVMNFVRRDDRSSPVYHAERPHLCSTLWAWCIASRGFVCSSWDLFSQQTWRECTPQLHIYVVIITECIYFDYETYSYFITGEANRFAYWFIASSAVLVLTASRSGGQHRRRNTDLCLVQCIYTSTQKAWWSVLLSSQSI